MIRQFVNLVVQDNVTGARSLHRLDVAKHLFYPSTARAEAASTKNREKEISNGGDKQPRIASRLLRRLPPPTMCLQSFAAADHGRFPPDETFTLLGAHGSDGRILHAGEGGQVLLYDADAGSTATLPNLAEPPEALLREPIFISVAGAGAGEEKESLLYVITVDTDVSRQRHSFEVLDLSQLPHRWEWEHLPPPPFLQTSSRSGVKSFTVVDGGRTICVSVKNKGTYCLDTRSREWWKAGRWTLPFHGRFDYVPELHSWIGSCFDDHDRQPGESDDYLCSSSDLLAVSAMDARPRAAAGAPRPKLQHVWQDINPPDEKESIELKGRLLRGVVLGRTMQWVLRDRHLINLGGSRFCIAKNFMVQRVVTMGFGEEDTETEAEFVELSGVEVVRRGGDDDGGELRMVKHKSKRYMSTTDEIKWVL